MNRPERYDAKRAGDLISHLLDEPMYMGEGDDPSVGQLDVAECAAKIVDGFLDYCTCDACAVEFIRLGE